MQDQSRVILPNILFECRSHRSADLYKDLLPATPFSTAFPGLQPPEPSFPPDPRLAREPRFSHPQPTPTPFPELVEKANSMVAVETIEDRQHIPSPECLMSVPSAAATPSNKYLPSADCAMSSPEQEEEDAGYRSVHNAWNPNVPGTPALEPSMSGGLHPIPELAADDMMDLDALLVSKVTTSHSYTSHDHPELRGPDPSQPINKSMHSRLIEPFSGNLGNQAGLCIAFLQDVLTSQWLLAQVHGGYTS